MDLPLSVCSCVLLPAVWGQCSSVGSSLLWVSEDWNGILCEFQSRSMDGTGILSGCKVTVKQNKDLSVDSKILPNSRPLQ